MSSGTNKSKSYWQNAWIQFKQKRIAMLSLYIAILLFIIAVYAPFIASRIPFVWTDNSGITSYPLFREFFAPMDSKEKFIEYLFNYLAIAAPLLISLRLLLKVKAKLPIIISLCLLAVPFILTQSRNQPDDYKALEKANMGHGIFTPISYGPYQQKFAPKLPPNWAEKHDTENERTGYNLLGTDEVGRDVMVRMIYGARVSLSVGFFSVGIATMLGIIIGSIAGYFGGWIDIAISRVIELIICFPTFFLTLTIIAFLEQRSILNIMLVIGLTGWTGTARLIRGEILKEKQLDYVTGARALGAKPYRIIFYHILPNSLSPVLVGISFGIAGAILSESGLSFLGLGVATPTATWGELLNEGRDSPLSNWWLTMFPGIAIFIAMTTYNLIGEGLRDAMDPRLKK